MNVLRALEEIRAIAQTGLAYTTGPYDRERYEQLNELYARLLEGLTPIRKQELERYLPMEEGYRTPKIDVRAVIVRDHKILLTQERSDHCWTLPGGWGDVGYSPSGNCLKEVREETGYEARCLRLLALLDRDLHPHPKSLAHSYKAFFHCEIVGGEVTPNLETEAVDFFSLDSLPPLSIQRATEEQIRRCFELALNPQMPPWFD